MRPIIDMAIAGGVAFVGVTGLQSWWITRTLGTIGKREQWAETLEQWSQLTRQDVAGVLLSLGITNGLLAAIAAILLVR